MRRRGHVAAGAAALAALLAASPGALAAGKAGPWMLDLNGGFAIGKDSIGPSFGHPEVEDQWVLGLDAGWGPLLEHNAYVVLSPSLAHGSISTDLTLAAGFQYDLPVKALSSGELYVYGRAVAGYTAVEQRHATAHSFTLIPAIGVKYVVNGRLNLALEPLDVALFQIGEVAVESRFRFLASVGVNL